MYWRLIFIIIFSIIIGWLFSPRDGIILGIILGLYSFIPWEKFKIIKKYKELTSNDLFKYSDKIALYIGRFILFISAFIIPFLILLWLSSRL